MDKMYSVGITGTGSYMPENILTNFQLEKIVDTSDQWIRKRTGIKNRRISDENTATSDLATMAAKNALKSAGISPTELELIIIATVTPDMSFPSTACIVQKNLGAAKAAAFDIEAACSGFVYALTVAEQFIKSGYYKNALVIGAETLSKITDWEDRSTCVLFGDGAGAVILERAEEGYGILSSNIGADGEQGHFLTLPAGGSRNPASVETIENKLHYIKMAGNEVFKFAVRAMESSSHEALEKCGLSLEDIDYLIPHQANIRIIEAAAKRLNIPMDKVYVNLDNYGNMSSASIPVALDEAVNKGFIKKGQIVLLVAFGGGLTWASSIIKWSK